MAEAQLKPNGAEHSLLIGRLSQDALVRLEAETRAFLADYLPKIAREGNKAPIHDAELLRELAVYKFNLVARECMMVFNSVREFEDVLYLEISD